MGFTFFFNFLLTFYLQTFLRIITAVAYIFAFFGFVAFLLGRKLASEDKTVKILGILDWIATAIIVGTYALAFFVMAIW